MNILFSLLPIYLLGNVHCAGMCGPLVMVLAKHPHRWGYFLGRLLSFSLAGVLSAEMGVALFSFLARYHISALFSLLFGAVIMTLGASLFFKLRPPWSVWLAKRGAKFAGTISRLLLKNSFHSVFLFGMCTLLLPCGQIVIVYSIIALNCTPLTGLLNGFLFAFLTSPSLVAAMKATSIVRKEQKNYHLWMGGATFLIGTFALLRGLADFSFISHWVLNPRSPPHFHIIIF